MKKIKQIQLKTTEKKHAHIKKIARKNGMTITGMIRYALKKVFKIEI